jgi:uncharacterized protein YjbI with pentapeptide repeats
MDRERFDALARLFATTGSRRRAIGALLSVAVLGREPAASDAKGKGKDHGNGHGKSRGKGHGRGHDRDAAPETEAASVDGGSVDVAPEAAGGNRKKGGKSRGGGGKDNGNNGHKHRGNSKNHKSNNNNKNKKKRKRRERNQDPAQESSGGEPAAAAPAETEAEAVAATCCGTEKGCSTTVTPTNRNRYQCYFPGVDFSNRTVGSPQGTLENANFAKINGNGAKFDNSYAFMINLSGACLTGATFLNTNLTQANLSNACLVNANLKGANLTRANTSGVIYCNTIDQNGQLRNDSCGKRFTCCEACMQQGQTCSASVPCCRGGKCCGGVCVPDTKCCVNNQPVDCDAKQCLVCSGTQCVTKCTDPNKPTCDGDGNCVCSGNSCGADKKCCGGNCIADTLCCVNNQPVTCNVNQCLQCVGTECVTKCTEPTLPDCNGSGACVCNATSCTNGCCNQATGACVPYAQQNDNICGQRGICAPCQTGHCNTTTGICVECLNADDCDPVQCNSVACTSNQCVYTKQTGPGTQCAGAGELCCAGVCTQGTCCVGSACSTPEGPGNCCVVSGATTCLVDDVNNCASCGNICPASTNPCQVAVCNDRICGFANVANNTACSAANGPGVCCAGQCRVDDVNNCASCGNICPAPQPPLSPQCATAACDDKVCKFNFAPSGTPCTAGVCNGSGVCVQCVSNAQCTPLNTDCVTYTCNTTNNTCVPNNQPNLTTCGAGTATTGVCCVPAPGALSVCFDPGECCPGPEPDGCDVGEICNANHQCECNSTSCPDGCCRGGSSGICLEFIEQSPTECGDNGVTCINCTTTAGPNYVCQNGNCVCPTPNFKLCGANCIPVTACCTGTTPGCTDTAFPDCCNGTCTNDQTDPNNCGTCGNPCSGQTPDCSGGACVCNSTSCGVGMKCCGGVCISNTLCCTGTTQGCVGNPNGTTCCSGTCTNTQTDPLNCGACGVPCSSGICVGGACSNTCGTITCGTGTICCGANNCVSNQICCGLDQGCQPGTCCDKLTCTGPAQGPKQCQFVCQTPKECECFFGNDGGWVCVGDPKCPDTFSGEGRKCCRPKSNNTCTTGANCSSGVCCRGFCCNSGQTCNSTGQCVASDVPGCPS